MNLAKTEPVGAVFSESQWKELLSIVRCFPHSAKAPENPRTPDDVIYNLRIMQRSIGEMCHRQWKDAAELRTLKDHLAGSRKILEAVADLENEPDPRLDTDPLQNGSITV